MNHKLRQRIHLIPQFRAEQCVARSTGKEGGAARDAPLVGTLSTSAFPADLASLNTQQVLSKAL